MQISHDDIDASALVITEYLTNLLRHSRGEDEAITLLISEGEANFTVALIDDLTPYNLFELNNSTWSLYSDDLVEGGMGVALIRHYFPKACYESKHGKNYFSFELNKTQRKTTVLYVDDDVAQLALIQAYVQQDYTFISSQGCSDAWQIITQSKVDILLLDYRLKNDTCETLLAQLINSDFKGQLSILILTSENDADTVKKLNRFGIDDYMAKPITKERLLLNLDRVQHKLNMQLCRPRGAKKEYKYDMGFTRSAHLFGTITTELGGDFFIELDTNNKGFVLGDIMGHGLSAHQKSYEIKGFINGFVSSFAQVDTLASALNVALHKEKLCKNCLLTLLVVYFDEEYIHFYNAGHPPPIAIGSDGEFIPLSQSDPLLGLSLDHVYKRYQYPLQDITHLICYTDGWVENLGSTLNEESQIIQNLPNNSLKGEAYATRLWLNSQARLSKEFDDASLVVIN
jgi:sigma-B regulation protein RsbU (phosphoserine phosphatase)